MCGGGNTVRDILRDRQRWGRNGMVSTGSPPATLAALDVLREGGTAFDAAITASAVLTVALPMACGPGGDGVAVLHRAGQDEPVSLTALGRAPRGASPEAYRSRGLTTVPATGALSLSTPALIDGWYRLHREYGTLPFERLLEPAIDLAVSGVPVTAQVARWTRDNLAALEQPGFRDLYEPHGSPDAVGSVLCQPGLAALYSMVASAHRTPETLRAELADAITPVSDELGGLIARADLLVDHARVEPAATVRLGQYSVATTPAPTQGPLLLQNLALYRSLSRGQSSDRPDMIHLLAEIIDQTYGWRLREFGDPEFVDFTDPLDPALLASLASGVDPDKRSPSSCLGHYTEGDTSHFAVLDREGNGVSWVQSLGLGFGSGIGVPELGLFLGNRLGRSATIDPVHPNVCAPGKRPVNTIFPWSSSGPEGLRWLGGTPGGDGQTQWNAQVLLGLIEDSVSPLQALSRPRWTYYPGCDKVEAAMEPQLRVDDTMDAGTVAGLGSRGHEVVAKASVGGVVRVLERGRNCAWGLDEGRHEGLTVGW
ncbi:gamma-glutamyltransferase [Nocardiopsis exhalans]